MHHTKLITDTPDMTFEADIAQAVECLRRGGVILYPTDTVWGIGCDATRSDAVRRVFDIKRRAEAKALITLVSDTAMLERYVDDIPYVALELVEAAVTPVTVVYDHPVGLAPELLAPDGSVGIRVVSEQYCMQLCKSLRRPIVSTSANFSGLPAPSIFDEISPDIIALVDYVASYRRDDRSAHTPSAVIKISNDCTIKILRK